MTENLNLVRLRYYAIIVMVLMAACGTNTARVTQGPRLIQDVTLAPTTPAPTRQLSPTPTPVNIPIATSENEVPLQIVTIEADFVLVTPTLPPSKTPTITPSVTPTFTPTITPTFPVTSTQRSPQQPTAILAPVTAIVANAIPRVCDSTWFFIQPRPDSCPQSQALTSQATFQIFENGFMLWVRSQDIIYVMYNDGALPTWQAFNDPFVDPTPERTILMTPPPGEYWQPRRGFGEIWLMNPEVRQRIGWAVQQWEDIFSSRVQISTDGTVFVEGPRNDIFMLPPGGRQWTRSGGNFNVP
ncbi:MAG: hypothetical protein D6737_04955 [Chloroflexi bacterium]|nr:MAG: hypothetical protein D6737_04955 [Chloroflexota bacterium]